MSIEANQQKDGTWTVYVDDNESARGLTLQEVDEQFGCIDEVEVCGDCDAQEAQ